MNAPQPTPKHPAPADAEPDFLSFYTRTARALPRRDRTALDAALRAVTRVFAGRRRVRRRLLPKYAHASLPTFADHVEGEPFPDLPGLPAGDVAAIARGLADLDAGRVQDGDVMIAGRRERLANLKPGEPFYL